MNKQISPVSFRKMTEAEEIFWMGCEEKPLIAQCKDVIMDGNLFDVEIVIDLWTNLHDKKEERMGFYFTSKDRSKSCGYMFISQDAKYQKRRILKKIAREVMQVNHLSIVTFEANHFDVFEN